MTQHPAAAGILYDGLNCPPIGGKGEAFLLVNSSGSCCYWVELDATNGTVKMPFPWTIFDCKNAEWAELSSYWWRGGSPPIG